MEETSKNTIKWSGFFKNDEAAQEHLQQKLLLMSQNKLIVSAKKDLQSKGTHDLLLYKFTIITSEK